MRSNQSKSGASLIRSCSFVLPLSLSLLLSGTLCVCVCDSVCPCVTDWRFPNRWRLDHLHPRAMTCISSFPIVRQKNGTSAVLRDLSSFIYLAFFFLDFLFYFSARWPKTPSKTIPNKAPVFKRKSRMLSIDDDGSVEMTHALTFWFVQPLRFPSLLKSDLFHMSTEC